QKVSTNAKLTAQAASAGRIPIRSRQSSASLFASSGSLTSRMRRVIATLRTPSVRASRRVEPIWLVRKSRGARTSPLGGRGRHGLDVVTVGIVDEGRIIVRTIVRPQARRAIIASAGRDRRLVE